MKKKFFKCLSFLIIGALIIGMMISLSGCGIYSKEELEESTKKHLKEKYGENFEIKRVLGAYDTIAYPTNDPELIFKSSYVISNGNAFDYYLQELVAKQFKEQIEEKLKDFEYDYYVDVDVGLSDLPGAGSNITIEEHDELTKGTPQYSPTYRIFFSDKTLDLSNKELYDLIVLIDSNHDCTISMFFLTDDDLKRVIDDFSNYTSLSSNMSDYLTFTRKYNFVVISTNENRQWNTGFEKFEEKMGEVRNNEIYR